MGINHTRRLTPQEIAERFGAQRREHDAAEKRRTTSREKSQRRFEAALFLAEQSTPEISGSMADGLRNLGRLRGPQGRFIGVKHS